MLGVILNHCYAFGNAAKRIQNKAVVNETRSVEELSALLGKAEATLELQQVR